MTPIMTEIAAHRGGAALWPENSATAFQGAIALGVEQIEFDVQMTADHVPVIFHDTTLDRMTNGTGPLADRTLAQLKELEITGGGGQILTLEEGVDIMAPSGIVLRCEIKPGPGMIPYAGLTDATLAILSRHGLFARTVITSFHLPILAEVASKALPMRDVIWLVADPIARLLSPTDLAILAHAAGVGAIAPHWKVLAEGTRLSDLRAADLRASAFGVLEDAAIVWALGTALPVFTTDRPDAALRLRLRLRHNQKGGAA